MVSTFLYDIYKQAEQAKGTYFTPLEVISAIREKGTPDKFDFDTTLPWR